jgi:ABC-type nitrate/sulfonate/bicarbonate transport system permease component
MTPPVSREGQGAAAAPVRLEIRNRAAFLEAAAPRWVSPASVLSLVLAWEAAVRGGLIPAADLPAPSTLLVQAWSMAAGGQLEANLWASLVRIFWGLLLGGSAGVLAGLLTGSFALVQAAGEPVLMALYPIPKIAVLPLVILWLGAGETPKIAIIALGVFFPLAINTHAGVRTTDPLLMKAAVSFGATRASVIRKVVLPSALPSILAGLRLASGTSLLLLVAAEMLAAEHGLGADIMQAADLMQVPRLLVGVGVLSVLGLLFNAGVSRLERWLIPWKS